MSTYKSALYSILGILRIDIMYTFPKVGQRVNNSKTAARTMANRLKVRVSASWDFVEELYHLIMTRSGHKGWPLLDVAECLLSIGLISASMTYQKFHMKLRGNFGHILSTPIMVTMTSLGKKVANMENYWQRIACVRALCDEVSIGVQIRGAWLHKKKAFPNDK